MLTQSKYQNNLMSQLEEKTGRFVAFCQGPHSNLEIKWIPRYMTSWRRKNFLCKLAGYTFNVQPANLHK